MRSPVGHSMPPTSQGCQRITGVADLRHHVAIDLPTLLGLADNPGELDGLRPDSCPSRSMPRRGLDVATSGHRPRRWSPSRLRLDRLLPTGSLCGNTFWLETKPAVFFFFRAARNRQSGPTLTTPRRSVATTKVGRPRRATFIASAEDTIDSRRTISGKSLPNLAPDCGGQVHEVGRKN